MGGNRRSVGWSVGWGKSRLKLIDGCQGGGRGDAPLDVGGVHLVEEADLVPVDDQVLVVEVHRALVLPVHLWFGGV